MQRRFRTLAAGLAGLLRIVAGIALFGMIGATVADILCRHLLGFSLRGVVDGVEFLFAWMTFLGFAAAFFTGAHISVDVIDLALSPRARRALRLANGLVAAVVMGCLTWIAVTELLDKYDWGDRTIDLKIPLTWFWGAVVLGFGLSVVAILAGLCLPAAEERP